MSGLKKLTNFMPAKHHQLTITQILHAGKGSIKLMNGKIPLPGSTIALKLFLV